MNELQAFNFFNTSVFLHFIGRLLYRSFVPIVILSNGYSLDYVYLYVIGYSFLTILFALFSVKIFLQKNVLLFNILAILSEILLVFLLIPNDISYLILTLITLCEAIYYGLYYISYHAIISHYSTLQNTSNNLGNLSIINNIASIIAPIMGALLLEKDKFIFVLVPLIALILSVIPLLKITKTDINGKDKPKINIKNIHNELLSNGISAAIESVITVFWSIYIYIEGYSLLHIGYIATAIAIGDIILIYTIKKKLTNIHFRNLTKIISLLGIVSISIYRYINPADIILTNSIIGIFFMAMILAFRTDIFEKVKGYQTYHSSMLLSVYIFTGWTIISITSYFIGLKYTILLPVFLCLLWFIINIREMFKTIKHYL